MKLIIFYTIGFIVGVLACKDVHAKEIDINEEYVKCIAEEIKHPEIKSARLLSGYTCIVKYDLKLNPGNSFEVKEAMIPSKD